MSDDEKDRIHKPVEPMSDGRPMYYMLDNDDNPVPWTGTLLEWSDYISALDPDRHFIKRTVVGETKVATAFLGVDDAAATLREADGPEVFGTCVFGGDEYFDTTKQAALARHDRIVEKLRKGLSLDDEDTMDSLSRCAKRMTHALANALLSSNKDKAN